MACAVFPDDEFYHLVRAEEYYTLCGLPTPTAEGAAAERTARAVKAFFWSDAPRVRGWLCRECAAALGLEQA